MLNKITYLFLIFIAFSCSSSYIGKISNNETINTENSLYVNYIPILSNSEKFQNVIISSIVLDSLKPILNKKNINEIVSLEELKTYPFSDSSKLHNFSFFIGSRPNENSL